MLRIPRRRRHAGYNKGELAVSAAGIQTRTAPSAGKRAVRVPRVRPVCLEDSLLASRKTRHPLTIARVGICPKELKTYVHAETCTQTFVAAVLTVASSRKQPRCPSVKHPVVHPDSGLDCYYSVLKSFVPRAPF